MNNLLKKYNDYMRLNNCTVEYEFCDGNKISFTYKEDNFLHLLGLHKLTDIQLIQFWLDRNNKTVKMDTVINKIIKMQFTDTMVQQSFHYPKIKDRYEKFTYDNLTTLNYTDAVVDFDSTLINSKLKSKYILFEEKDFEYNHMGIALDVMGGYRYVETFFHEPTDKYIAGQTIVKVKKFTLYDSNRNVIVEDSF